MIGVSESPTGASKAISLAGALDIIRDVFRNWVDDDAGSYSAAIAFFTIFSLAPILVIATAVAGMFWGEAQVWGEIIAVVRQNAGLEAAQILEYMLFEWNSNAGMAVSFLGFLLMIWGASKVFVQIQIALNAIWNVKTEHRGKSFIRNRMFSFAMVLLVGVWTVLSLFLDAGLRTAIAFVPDAMLPMLAVFDWISEVADFFVAVAMFGLMFKFLPETLVYWRDALFGGLVAAILFGVGRFLVGLYLVTTGVASAYGAAGSLIVLLLWVYYSVQIFLFAAECAFVMSVRYRHLPSGPN